MIIYQLKPLNKYIQVEDVDKADKVGSIFVPGNTSNQYRLARVKAFSFCDETVKLSIGCVVLYDTIGAISHRIGNQTVTTVKAVNVIGIVEEVAESVPIVDARGSEAVDAFVDAIVKGHG